MTEHFLVFGSHPFLSLAEAKAVLGGPAPILVGPMAVFDTASWDGQKLQNRLAGTIKSGELVDEMSFSALTPARLADLLEARPMSKGKSYFSFTLYGGASCVRERMKKFPLQLKRELQERGLHARWVTGEGGDVAPAAIAKLDLIHEGADFCLGLTDKKVLVGITTHVQDATAWSERDYGRPARDMRNGMLPPKLARMMVNLAGQVEAGAPASHALSATSCLLDPFCGGGTVLMEAALLGYTKLIGTDSDAEQIQGTQKNMDWLYKKGLISESMVKKIRLETRRVQDLDAPNFSKDIDIIVTEGFLGEPLRGHEPLSFLHAQKEKIEELWRETLRTVSNLQPNGGRLVCSWPVFVSPAGTVAVDIRDEVKKFGYRIIDPLEGWVKKSPTLTYARPDQRVKRNIIVMERI